MNAKVNTSNQYRRCRALLTKIESRGATNGEAASAYNTAVDIVAKYGLDPKRMEWPAAPTGYRLDDTGHMVKVEPKPKKPSPRKGKKFGPRTGTLQATIIELMRRPQGATTEELVAATNWQKHTVRGSISGALRKGLGLNVLSERKDGVTTYKIID